MSLISLYVTNQGNPGYVTDFFKSIKKESIDSASTDSLGGETSAETVKTEIHDVYFKEDLL